MSATTSHRRFEVHAPTRGRWIVALSFALATIAVAQDDVGPIDDGAAVSGYKATVIVPSAFLRSGPSHANYPTEKLVRGDTVDVYRTAAGGWVGVRPTSRSFSWLPESHVEVDPDDPELGYVVTNGAEAWIGSNVERVKRHESQVALHEGEEIQILGRKVPADGGEAWLKIAAPAGEFRWIHSKNLSGKSANQLAAEDAQAEIDRARRLIERGAKDPDELPAEAWSDRGSHRAGRREDPESTNDVERAQFLERIRERVRGRGKSTGRGQGEESGESLSPPVVGDRARPSRPERRGFEHADDESIDMDDADALAEWDGQEIVVDEETAQDDAKLMDYLKAKMRRGRSERAAEERATKEFADEESGPVGSTSPFDEDWVRRRRQRARARSHFAEREPTPDRDLSRVDPEYRRRLDKWESDLTIEASRDPSQWNMAALRERGERLLAQARTPLERGLTRLTLDRIAAFESTSPGRDLLPDPGRPAPEIARRDPVGERREEAWARDRRDANEPRDRRSEDSRSERGAPAPKASLEARYDAVGVLMPVYDNQRKGLPPYQLVDEDGNLIRYVTPEPGVNLRRYERKTVGLTGPRGYIETLQRDHLTARSVVDLERTRR